MPAIKIFEDRKARSVWNEKEQKWYFSVQDVIQILTDTINAKDYIKKMRKRDDALKVNWGTICSLVEMEAGDKSPGRVKIKSIIKTQKMNYIYNTERTTNIPQSRYFDKIGMSFKVL